MSIQSNIAHLQQIIAAAEAANHRGPGDVLLLAVSKQQDASAIAQAHQHGLDNFAENYFQEGQQKIAALSHLPLTWHFIGPIQSNKTKGISAAYHWVHSIDRLSIAQKLNDYRPAQFPPINCCLQINLTAEASKSGIAPDQAEELAKAVSQLPMLNLRGLMTIPPVLHDEPTQYALFLQLKQLLVDLNKKLGLTMDTLSMGMSDDLLPAIQAGATIVRVGRALFGERARKTI